MATKRARASQENGQGLGWALASTGPGAPADTGILSPARIPAPTALATQQLSSKPFVAALAPDGPCHQCGQENGGTSQAKLGLDLARILSYERGGARSCPCCCPRAISGSKASRGKDGTHKRAEGRAKPSQSSTLAPEEEHVLRARMEKALCQAARLQRACARIAGRVGDVRSRACEGRALWRWRWAVQVEKATAWSARCEAQAARVEALTAEVAAGAARLGERRELWAGWRAWRRGSQQRRHERRRAVLKVTAMAQRARRAHLRGAFLRWAAATAQMRRRAALLRKAVARLQHHHLAAAFSAWKESTADQRRRQRLLERAVRRMRQLQAGAAFARWRTQAQARRRLEGLLTRVAQRWQQREVAACWDTWKEAVRARRVLRSKMIKVVRRMQCLHLHTAFSAWLAWVAARRSARDVMARVVGRFQHRLLAAALAAWQEWVRQSKRTRTTAFEVIARLSQRTLARAFLAWRLVLMQQAAAMGPPADSDQPGDDLFEGGPATWQPVPALSEPFLAWRVAVRHMRRSRALAQRVVQRWRHRTLAATFAALAEHLRTQRTRRAALMAVCSRRWALQTCAGLALERWRVATLCGRGRRLQARLAAAEAAAAEARMLQRQSAHEHAAALSRCVPVPQVTALAGALEGRLRTHAAAAQQATQCTGRLAALLWRQRCVARAFHRWSRASQAAQADRGREALQHAEAALRNMVRELSAEAANRRLLEASMVSIVTERADDASSTRAMLEGVEEQVHHLRALIRRASPGDQGRDAS